MSVIDTSADAVANVLTFGGTLMECHGVAAAGDEMLITNRAGQSLVFVDNGSLEKAGTLDIAGRPDIVAVSPNCARAYFSLRDRPAVAVVDVKERRYLGAIDMGPGDTHGIAVLRTGD